MKTWQKILTAFIGSGANGALTFAATQWPEYSTVTVPMVMAITAGMSLLIGWPPKTEV